MAKCSNAPLKDFSGAYKSLLKQSKKDENLTIVLSRSVKRCLKVGKYINLYSGVWVFDSKGLQDTHGSNICRYTTHSAGGVKVV